MTILLAITGISAIAWKLSKSIARVAAIAFLLIFIAMSAQTNYLHVIKHLMVSIFN